MGRQPVSYPAFYQKWGDEVSWNVPDVHLQACDWLQHGRTQRIGVLKAFRGFSKSTLVGRYSAWRLREDEQWRFLAMSATDIDAAKMSSDSRFVLERHPWCRGMRGDLWKTHRYKVDGALDPRNPSMAAYGVLSNITGGRADEIILDDVEVPKTIANPQLRESLRNRLDETIHILVPGGKILYVGTDHCVDSIYKEQIEHGADLLEIPLFRKETNHKATGDERDFPFKFRIQKKEELFVIVGGVVLPPDQYEVHGVRDFKGGYVRLKHKPFKETVVNLYGDCSWPKRFTRDEIIFRRTKCRTQNAWDSQYQLKARPIGEIKLDPDRLIPYEAKPEIRKVNGEVTCWLNGTRMIGVNAYWDCSLGKVSSDASAFCVVYTDSNGYLYWHVAEGLKGEIDEQCQGVVRIVRELSLPSVKIETNGPGGFVPAILRRHLFSAGIQCAVNNHWSVQNKNLRILDALEPPLSGMFLYASRAVIQTVGQQMREFDPKVKDQPDDYLDAGAGAIADTPVRIGRVTEEQREEARRPDDFRTSGGTYDIAVDF